MGIGEPERQGFSGPVARLREQKRSFSKWEHAFRKNNYTRGKLWDG